MPIPIQIGGNVGLGATPTAVGGSSFSGLRNIGAGLENLATVMQEDQNHRDRLKAVELEGAAQRRWAEGVSGLDPTADDYLDRVDETFRTVQEDILTEPGISSRGVREDLELTLTRHAQHGMLSAVTTRRGAIEEKGLALFDERADETLAQIREDPDGFDAYVTGFAGTAEQIGPAVSAPAMAERLRAAGDLAILAKVEGLANAGRYDEAQAFLKDAQGELSPEDQRSAGRLIRTIQNQHNQDFESATAKAVADIDIAISDAITGGDIRALDGIRNQIEKDPSLWQHRQDKRASLIQEIEVGRRRLIDDQRDTLVALQKYHSGTGNDDQTEADLAHAALSSQLDEDATPEERAAFNTAFVKRSGFVPTSEKRLIENAERVDNPQQLAFAAQQDAHYSDVAPGVDTGAGNRVALTRAFEEIGLPYEEAAQLVIDRAPDKATSSARGEEFDEEYKDTDWREYLADAGLAGGGFSPGIINAGGITAVRLFAPDADVPEELAQETERASRLFYQMSGDFDAAQKATIKHLERTFGTSEVGGRLRVQRYAPERYMPVGDARDMGLRARAIDGLVRRVVSAAGAEVPSPKNGLSHSLVTDDQTERDLRAGLQPSYEVRVRSKIGDVMVPVWVETPGGRTKLRLRLPDATTANTLPEVQEARKAAMGKVEARDNLRRVAKGVGQAAAATLGPGDDRTVMERHPYQGWMQRRRAERKAREK